MQSHNNWQRIKAAVATFNSILELKGFLWIVSLHLLATLGVQWRLAAFRHGKYSSMYTFRHFKSSSLPKAAVTPLPCPASLVPAAALPTGFCTGNGAAEVRQLQGKAVGFHPDLNAGRRATAQKESCQRKGRRWAGADRSSWERTAHGSAFIAVVMGYASLNCMWNSRHG